MTSWGTRESSKTCRRQPTPYAVILAKAGIQYNMCGEIRLIISLLDSRYDEKYSRWRSLFFYRSGMTTYRRHSRAAKSLFLRQQE